MNGAVAHWGQAAPGAPKALRSTAHVVFPLSLVVAAIAFPVLAPLVPGVQALPFNFANYSIALLAGAFVARLVLVPSIRKPSRSAIWLFAFGAYVVGTLWVKGVWSGELQPLSSRAMGVLLGSLATLWVSQVDLERYGDQFFRGTARLVAALFLLQVIVSVIESRIGAPIGKYGVPIYSPMSARDILPLFGLSLEALFGLKMPLTGMLGQHNIFGNMVVYCNLMFLTQWFADRRPAWLLMVMVAALAALGNTTRTSLAIVLATDCGAFLLVSRRPLRRTAAFVALMAILAAGMVAAYQEMWQGVRGTDTLGTRVALWSLVGASSSRLQSLAGVLFGLGADQLLALPNAVHGVRLASFENQLLAAFFYTGTIGTLLFVYVFVIRPFVRSIRVRGAQGNMLALFAMCVALSSITLDVNWNFSSYVLITILYLRLMRGTEPVRTAPLRENPRGRGQG